jgi:hypothetical protein
MAGRNGHASGLPAAHDARQPARQRTQNEEAIFYLGPIGYDPHPSGGQQAALALIKRLRERAAAATSGSRGLPNGNPPCLKQANPTCLGALPRT